jgi:hypothetical protein
MTSMRKLAVSIMALVVFVAALTAECAVGATYYISVMGVIRRCA